MRELVRRIGQRVLVGFAGKTASPDAKSLIRDYGAGHVILLPRNVDRPEQVADLVRELQAVARDAGHELPLLVWVDQEGGRVAALGDPWTAWPSPRAVGRTGSEDVARRMGAAVAGELRACGIRANLAPVLDLDTNPANPVVGDRAFGGDPALAGRLGAALVEGLQGGGVAACAKHFPGHGDTDVDPRVDLPSVDHPRSRLEDRELRPFRQAIEAGVAGVMTAHVLFREIDDRLPATLSPRLVEDLLRGEMAYPGVVVADDLEMGAVAGRWKPGPAAVLAARAGCDVFPVCSTPDAQVAAIEALVRAVESEEIAWSALDDPAERIRRLKERFLLPWRDPDPRQARLAVGEGRHRALVEQIGAASGLPA